jgi:prephenate dehydrogenase
VAIIGAGQVGTMIGLALRSRPSHGSDAGPAQVAVFDRDRAVAERSLARGSANRILPHLEDALTADAIVLAVPVPEIVKLIDEFGRRLPVGSLVIDTGSAKRVVVKAMRRSISEGVHAIGGHPMAGTERPGAEGASAKALAGAAFVLTPIRDDGAAVGRAAGLAEAAGARPVVMDAESHDRVVALTSHLPHVMAFALAGLAGDAAREGEPVAALASTGFSSAARLSRTDPEMVAAFLSANADEVRQALGRLMERLQALDAALDDEPRLKAMLAVAHAERGTHP